MSRSALSLGVARCVVLAVLFAPLVYLCVLSVAANGAGAALERATRPEALSVLLRTIAIALTSTLLAFALGAGAGWVFERRRFVCSGALRLAAFTPLFLPPVLQVAAWERLARPGALLTNFLPFLTTDGGVFPFRHPVTAAVVLAFSYSPVFFFFTTETLRGLPRGYLEALRVTRGGWAGGLRVTLPLCAPALLAAGVVVFTLAFGNYEVPRLLDVSTFSVLIQIEYGVRDDPGSAFALVLPSFLLSAALLVVGFTWLRRRRFAPAGLERGERGWRSERRAGPLAWLLFGGWWSLVVAVPLAVIVELTGGRLDVFAGAWQTDWEKILWGALTHGTAGVVTTALAALLLLPRPGRLARSSALPIWLLLATPSSLLAFALVRAGSSGPFFALYNSWWILVLAEVWRFFPIAFFALDAHLRGVPSEQRDAAAFVPSARTRWLGVHLPLAAPGLVLGAVAVALFASQELSTAVFLAPPGHEPLIVRIYNALHYGPERDVVAALALYHVVSMVFLCGLLMLGGALLRWRWR